MALWDNRKATLEDIKGAFLAGMMDEHRLMRLLRERGIYTTKLNQMVAKLKQRRESELER